MLLLLLLLIMMLMIMIVIRKKMTMLVQVVFVDSFTHETVYLINVGINKRL